MSEIITKGIPHKKLKPIIETIKNRIAQSQIVKDMFKEYDVDIAELDLVPICFAKIPVSARTDHGCIYLNINLLNNKNFINENDHYLVHELTHYLQQTTGSRPTQGSDKNNYLDNPVEQEGFQNQTKYISENKGDSIAENYISKLLDVYDIEGNERNKRREDLLNLAKSLNINTKYT